MSNRSFRNVLLRPMRELRCNVRVRLAMHSLTQNTRFDIIDYIVRMEAYIGLMRVTYTRSATSGHHEHARDVMTWVYL